MNKPHIEKEYKMMINEDIYNTLLSSLDVKTIVQKNYYYDTYKSNYAMRIREIDGNYIFTLKENFKDFKKEYEFNIANNDLNDKKVKEMLDSFEILNPKFLGCLTTTRSIIRYKYGELCIDKSEYLNNIDYEIEFELYDYKVDITDEFYELLNKFNLIYKKSAYSKFSRFKKAL